MRFPVIAVLLLLLPAVESAASEAGDPPAIGSLVHLGQPARRAAVDEAVKSIEGARKQDRVRLCEMLGFAGGSEAALGLQHFGRDAEPGVRTAAYEAAVRIGLRTRGLLRAARKDIGSREKQVRLAAVKALGVLGDGGDVPTLLDLADDKKSPSVLRRAAFEALRRLSGLRISYSMSRWNSWWRRGLARAERDTPGILASIEKAPEHPGMAEKVRTLERSGWILLPEVRVAVTRWLSHDDERLRAAASRLAGRLGLADQARAVAKSWRSIKFTEHAAVGREALLRLGLPAD